MADSDEIKTAWSHLGRTLAQLRVAAGHTQHGFARLVQYGRSSVANTETGRQQPDRAFWVRCDSVLQTGGVLAEEYDRIVFLARQRQRDSAMHAATRSRLATAAAGEPADTCTQAEARRRRPVDAASAQRGNAAEPRQAITNSGSIPLDRSFLGRDGFADDRADAYVDVERSIMNAARETSEHAMDAGAWAVSDATIEQLREDAARIARDFARLTPADAVSETLRLRNLAVALLERTRRPGQQRDLYLIAAQAAALLASESADLGLWPSAMQYARAAYTYGEVTGHDGVRAYARGMQATIAYWTGQPAEAVGYAEAAVALAPAGVARVRALSILARAWSHHGTGDDVRRTIMAAEDARGTMGQDLLHDIIGGEFGYTPAQQARNASTAWLKVGHTEPAIAAAVAALDLADDGPGNEWFTVPAEARVDLATCQLLTGQLDAAQETLAPLWSIPTDWRRAGLAGRLHRVYRVLSAPRWRKVPQARQVAELASSFGTTHGRPPALPPA
ncbi:hypothetical protein Vqi01_49480 [Micromonospora qiuiae]|uniref:Helix-turn-helix domain-containing protein n=1 Tax=Micromonospora qiuiae TaxID=502268 RepID=A0ABQ4JJU4_9ACTN|nr:helix-turn-helix transcriptional regulator [Micromonospora qiuiae]GIJ29786.1 hypothetical protein Vqi01_49480 [Micromonospora qiuiae]